MSAFLLLQAIRDYLGPRLAAFPLAVHGRDAKGCPIKPEVDEEGKPLGEAMRPCRVHIGSMPPTVNEALSAASFIVIQAMEGFDDGDFLQNIKVALRLCIVSGEPEAANYEAAENDLLNLLSQVRLWLLEAPGGCIGDGRFRLLPFDESAGKLPWERPDEQVFPFLQAHIFSQWQTLGAHKIPTAGMEEFE